MLGIHYINIDISCVVVSILTPQTTLTAQWDSADDAAEVLEKVSCCEQLGLLTAGYKKVKNTIKDNHSSSSFLTFQKS